MRVVAAVLVSHIEKKALKKVSPTKTEMGFVPRVLINFLVRKSPTWCFLMAVASTKPPKKSIITGLEKERMKILKPLSSRPSAPPGFARKKVTSRVTQSEVTKRGTISNIQKQAAKIKTRIVILSAELYSAGRRKCTPSKRAIVRKRQ